MNRTKGKFLNKQEWYSICSRHIEYDENCKLCQHGRWINIYIAKIDSFIYKNFPRFWEKSVNIYVPLIKKSIYTFTDKIISIKIE